MDNGTIININNVVDLNSKVTEEMFIAKISSFNDSYRNNLLSLSKIIGKAPIYFSNDNFLFFENTINSLGVNAVARLFKFAYLPEFMKSSSVLSDANNMNKFKFLYVNVLGNSLDNFDVLEFLDVLNKYEKYYSFCNNLLQPNITSASRNSLFRLFKSNISDFSIDSTNELKNIDKIMGNYYNNIILNGDLDAIKNSIFLLLINKKTKDVKFILSKIINYEKIGHLKESFRGAPLQDLLDNYGYMLTLLNEILESNNLNKLRQFALSLATNLLSSSDDSLSLIKEFSDLDKKAKKLYTLELNGSLTNIDAAIDDSKTMESIKFEKGKFSASDIVMTDGISLKGKKVDLIEFDEETTFLVHVTNVSGTGHYITDWKNPKLVGKSYICLSSFDNKIDTFHNDYRFKDIPDINTHIKLLFNKFDLNSLCTFGNTDISFGTPSLEIKENNLHLRSFNYSNSDDLDTFKEHRNAFNPHWYVDEYDFLRESFSGETIYPCAVAVVDSFPSQYEIDAAAYLDVPLVKINKRYSMSYDRCANNPKNSELVSSIISPNNQAKIKDAILAVRKIFKSLDGSLSDYQNAFDKPSFDRGVDSFEIDKFIGTDIKKIYEHDMLFTNIDRLQLVLEKIEHDNLFEDIKALNILTNIVSYIQADYKLILKDGKVDLDKFFIILDGQLKKIGFNHNLLEQDKLVELILSERKTAYFINKNIPNHVEKRDICLDTLSDLNALSNFCCARYKFMLENNLDVDKLFCEASDYINYLQKKLLIFMNEKYLAELRKKLYQDTFSEYLVAFEALLQKLGVSINDLIDKNKRKLFTSKMDIFLDYKLGQIEEKAIAEDKSTVSPGR